MFKKQAHSSLFKKLKFKPTGCLILLASTQLTTSCNSVFYQPDKLVYSLPQQFTQRAEEFFVPVEGTGEKLHVWKLHSNKTRKGTIVHFHGNAQNMTAHVWFVAWLIDIGFDVVTFDYRGYGQSDGHASRNRTIQDGQTILKWLATQPNSAPLFIIGQSLGGAVSYAAVASVSPELTPRGMIIESSFPSYRQLARRKLSSFFLTWPLQWPLSFLITDEWSPRDLKLQRPTSLLFVHGTHDSVVPYSEGLAFAEKAEQDKNDVHFYSAANQGHTGCFTGLSESSCMRRVMDFLESLTPEQSSIGRTQGESK